ncbi:hypothetical protein HF325_002589 [Metschnikowia pulcherrima]|uniref:Coatomer subunit epsilon n=1 Tax=Metschnikowia pulcherrima TaxID=27326 RepID=A0A8H7LCG1_9ASCO|nr:hypothetical protein HF325_002589 [Metschnikowia pulcherrima]
MNDISDSGELFTIRNQFYTGQHSKVVAYDLDLFSPEAQLKVLEFQVRSIVARDDDASLLIEQGKSFFPDQEEVFSVLQAWNDLATFGTDELTYFDDIAEATFETQAVLTALYLVKYHKDVDLAIALLTKFTARASENAFELEPYLLLVQLYLFKENFAEANKVVLFVMTLQLKHIPEAQEVLDQVAALDYKGAGTADMLANRITYEYLTNDGPMWWHCCVNWPLQMPSTSFWLISRRKNERFDAIVEKYQVV